MIYGGSTNGTATVLVTPPSGIASVPGAASGANNAIAQVINAPPGAAASLTGGTALPPDPGDPNALANEPRKVRTVVVKPDGTIVSSDATDAGAPAPGPAQVAALPTPATTAPTTAPAVRQAIPNPLATTAPVVRQATPNAPTAAAPPPATTAAIPTQPAKPSNNARR